MLCCCSFVIVVVVVVVVVFVFMTSNALTFVLCLLFVLLFGYLTHSLSVFLFDDRM